MILFLIFLFCNQFVYCMEVERAETIKLTPSQKKCNKLYKNFLEWEEERAPNNKKLSLDGQSEYLNRIHKLSKFLYENSMDEEAYSVAERGFKLKDPRSYLLASQVAQTESEAIELLKQAVENSSCLNKAVRKDAMARLEFEAHTDLDLLDYLVEKRLENDEARLAINYFRELLPESIKNRDIKVKLIRKKNVSIPEVEEDKIILVARIEIPQYKSGFSSLEKLCSSKAWKRLCDFRLANEDDIEALEDLKDEMQEKMMNWYYDQVSYHLDNKEFEKVFETCFEAESLLLIHENPSSLKIIEERNLFEKIKKLAEDNPALNFVIGSLYVGRASVHNYLFQNFSSLEEQVEAGLTCIPSLPTKEEKIKERLLYQAGIFYKKQGMLAKAIPFFEQLNAESYLHKEASLIKSMCSVIQQYTSLSIDELKKELTCLSKYINDFPNMSFFIMLFLSDNKLSFEDSIIDKDAMIRALSSQYERGSIIAAEFLQKLGQFPPSDNDPFKWAAECYLNQDYNKALEKLNLINPKNCQEFYYFKGLIYEKLKNYEEAVDSFMRQFALYQDKVHVTFINKKQLFHSSASLLDERCKDEVMANAIALKLRSMDDSYALYSGAWLALALYERNYDQGSYQLFCEYAERMSNLNDSLPLLHKLYEQKDETFDEFKWKLAQLVLKKEQELESLANDKLLLIINTLENSKKNDSSHFSCIEKQSIYTRLCRARDRANRNDWKIIFANEITGVISQSGFNSVVTTPYDIALLYLDGVTQLKRMVAIQKATKILEHDALTFHADESLAKLVELYEHGYVSGRKVYLKENSEKAIDLVKNLALKEDRAWALEKLGSWYRTGFKSINKDDKTAKKCLIQAFEKGYKFKELCKFYVETGQLDELAQCLESLTKADKWSLHENIAGICESVFVLIDGYKESSDKNNQYLHMIENCFKGIVPDVANNGALVQECFNKIFALDGNLYADVKWIAARTLYQKPLLFSCINKQIFFKVLSELKKTVGSDSFLQKTQKVELLYAFKEEQERCWLLGLAEEIAPYLKDKNEGPTSALEVAEFYLEDKTNKPRREAVKKAQAILLQDANEFGQFWSLKKLVKLYEEGFENYIPKNPKGAFSLLSSLAKKQNASALFLLSDWYRYGRTDCDLQVDKQKAGEYLEKAYKLDPELAGELGTFYFEQERYYEAFNFLSRSSLTSFGHCCMAMMYFSGKGTEQSSENFLKSVEKLVESKWDDRVRLYLAPIMDGILLMKISQVDLQADAKRRLLLGELYFMAKKHSRVMETTCGMIRDYFTFACKNGSLAQQCKAHIKNSETYFLEIEQDEKFSVDNFEEAIAEYVAAIEVLSVLTMKPHQGSQILASDLAKVYLQVKEYKELLENQKNVDPQQKDRILVHWKKVKECADELQLEVVAAFEMTGCQVYI